MLWSCHCYGLATVMVCRYGIMVCTLWLHKHSHPKGVTIVPVRVIDVQQFVVN